MESPKANVVVSELTFSLYQRPLHPELFNIYSRRHLKTEQYELMVWATGCSHVVSVFIRRCLSDRTDQSHQPAITASRPG